MANLEKPDDWTDEEFDVYLGSAEDPMNDEPDVEQAEEVDLYANYEPLPATGTSTGR
jgi:hypothetical protein